MYANGAKWPCPQRVLGSNHTNRWKIFKNLLFQNHLSQMLEFRNVALPNGPLPSLFNEGLRVQNGLTPGAPGFGAQKYIGKYEEKIFCLRTTWLSCLKFHIEDCIIELFWVCSNGGLRISKSSAALGFVFEFINSDEQFRTIMALLFLFMSPHQRWGGTYWFRCGSRWSRRPCQRRCDRILYPWYLLNQLIEFHKICLDISLGQA